MTDTNRPPKPEATDVWEHSRAALQLCVLDTGEVFRASIPYTAETWAFARFHPIMPSLFSPKDIPSDTVEHILLVRYELRGLPRLRYVWGPFEWGSEKVYSEIVEHLVEQVPVGVPRTNPQHKSETEDDLSRHMEQRRLERDVIEAARAVKDEIDYILKLADKIDVVYPQTSALFDAIKALEEVEK